jgi:hypothetical protein
VLVLARGFARLLWAPDYPWGLTPEQQHAVVAAYQLLYFGSHREAAERLGGPNLLYSDDDLEYFRRAAASPGTIESLATNDREVDVRYLLEAVRVPTLIVHPAEDRVFPVGGARHMAERIPVAQLVEASANGRFTERLLDEAKRFLLGVSDAGGLEELEPDRVLATILFTDIVGSSERAASLGDRAWRYARSLTSSKASRTPSRVRFRLLTVVAMQSGPIFVPKCGTNEGRDLSRPSVPRGRVSRLYAFAGWATRRTTVRWAAGAQSLDGAVTNC